MTVDQIAAMNVESALIESMDLPVNVMLDSEEERVKKVRFTHPCLLNMCILNRFVSETKQLKGFLLVSIHIHR